MSFFKSLARAFGFGESEDDAYSDAPSALVKPYVRPIADPVEDTAKPAEPEAKPCEPAPLNEGDIPLSLFDGIIDVINNAQPDFIKRCIDRDAQRRYLYEALGPSLNEYVESCCEKIQTDVSTRARQVDDKLNAEIDTLKEKCRTIKEKEEAWAEQKLSSDRQRRTLTNKVQELETKVLTLEAEKEQYQLENKSLVNRIRVSEVKDTDNTELRDEVTRLNEQLKAVEAEKESLQQSVEELQNRPVEVKIEQQDNPELLEKIEALNAQLKEADSAKQELVAEVEKLKKDAEETSSVFKTKMAMSDRMLSTLRNDSKNASQEVERLEEELKSLRTGHNQTLTRIDMLKRELSESQQAAAAARESLKDAKQIEEQLETEKNTVERLSNENNNLQKLVEDLKQEKNELRERVDALLQSSTEAADEETEQPVQNERKRRRKSSIPKISAIDETLDDTQWLIATPPEGLVAKTPGLASDADFGYQEPAKKALNDNSAQMSLFE
jgi:chromosome segregation ATPase